MDSQTSVVFKVPLAQFIKHKLTSHLCASTWRCYLIGMNAVIGLLLLLPWVASQLPEHIHMHILQAQSCRIWSSSGWWVPCAHKDGWLSKTGQDRARQSKTDGSQEEKQLDRGRDEWKSYWKYTLLGFSLQQNRERNSHTWTEKEFLNM